MWLWLRKFAGRLARVQKTGPGNLILSMPNSHTVVGWSGPTLRRPAPDRPVPAVPVRSACCSARRMKPPARHAAQPGRRAGRECRSGGEGDDLAGRADAWRHRTASAGRAAYVQRGLPARLPRRPARRSGRRARRARPGSTDAGNDWSAPPTLRRNGQGVRAVPCGRTSRLPGGRVGVHRRRTGHVQPAYAEVTQAAIDHEASKLLRHAEERAIELLKEEAPAWPTTPWPARSLPIAMQPRPRSPGAWTPKCSGSCARQPKSRHRRCPDHPG